MKTVHPTPCSATYSINTPAIKGKCNEFPSICSAVYSINNSDIICKANEFADVCTLTYTINSPTEYGKANTYPDICSASYEIVIPFFPRATANVFPETTSAEYNILNVLAGSITYVRPAASTLIFYVSPYYQVEAGGIPNYRDISKMPTIWLRKCNGMDYENERKLYRKVTTEAYNKFGVCMIYYVVSYDTQYDKIWGEDNNRRYIRRFDIMCRFPLPTEEKMWTKFAIEGIDNFSIFCSKNHFRTASTYGNTLVAGNIGQGTYPIYVPKNGDVLQSKYNKYLYEIVTVKEEAMMVHLSKSYVWDFVIKPYMDEHISLDPTTSASMGPISPFVSPNDIFKVNPEAQQQAGVIDYTQKSCEISPPAPFDGW